jgi:hypothetical protein
MLREVALERCVDGRSITCRQQVEQQTPRHGHPEARLGPGGA